MTMSEDISNFSENEKYFFENAMPLISDLERYGIKNKTPFEMYKEIAEKPEISSIFIKHLSSNIYEERILSTIARILGKCSEDISDQLISVYALIDIGYQNAKWEVSAVITDTLLKRKSLSDEKLSSLKCLINEADYSSSEFISIIAKFEKKLSEDFIAKFLDSKNSGFRNKSIVSLGKIKSEKYKSTIEKFLDDPDSYTRGIARKAISKIENIKRV